MGKNTCGGKTTTTNQRGSAGSLVDLDQGKKIQSQFCYLPDYPLQIKFLSLLERKAAKTSRERKTIKRGTKLAIKRKANEKRRDREKIEIGWKIVLCACGKNKNAALKF